MGKVKRLFSMGSLHMEVEKAAGIDNRGKKQYFIINKTRHGILSGTAPGRVVFLIIRREAGNEKDHLH